MNISKRIVEAVRELDLEKSEKYVGHEWTEALNLLFDLEPPIRSQIPFCVFEIMSDRLGNPILESEFDDRGERRNVDEDGNIDPNWKPGPVRYFRHDVFAILAWIAYKREDPDLTLDAMQFFLSDECIREIMVDVFLFWNVDIKAINSVIAEQLKSGEAPREMETESLDFPATVSSDKQSE